MFNLFTKIHAIKTHYDVGHKIIILAFVGDVIAYQGRYSSKSQIKPVVTKQKLEEKKTLERLI